MSTFNNVAVVRLANVYFDGGVTSRTIQFDNGDVKTLGIVQPGEYTFNTGKKEIIEIQAGECEVLPAGESEWREYRAGQTFEVEANSSFRIRAITLTDYCCSFVD